MSDTTVAKAEFDTESDLSDYIALLKPRVMILVVFTALVGIIAAPVDVHPFTILVSIIFIALGGGASGALNMWYESDIDSLMRRTINRPIPAGKITSDEAKAFGFALAGISVLMLGLAANWFAAALLVFTIFFLCCDLHNMVKKMDSPKYCYWWSSRCFSSYDWLGRCYFRNIS